MFKREVALYLWCQITNKGLTPVAPILTPVQDWVRRVQVNGGAKPSDATVAAMQTFYTALDTASILSKMISVVCFVPDNLIAAITPLIKLSGNDPWTNHNFVGLGTDLSVNGLKGNGTTKYLETGVFPASTIMTDSLAGITVYNTFATNQNGTDMGCQQAGGLPIMQAIVSFGDQNAYWDCFNTTVGQGRVLANDNAFTGYVSCNRTAANQTRIYRASVGLGGHQLLASGAGSSPQGRPASGLYCFAHADQTAIIPIVNFPVNFSNRQLSFAAIHQGLTQPESISFWTAIQTLRTNLGGGAV